MVASPFILTDLVRAEQFARLGGARALSDWCSWHDTSGVCWAGQRVGEAWLGFTWLGPGWVFDPYAQARRSADHTARCEAMRRAEEGRHQEQLRLVSRRIPRGRRAERLLWAIHRRLLQQKLSVLRIADFELARAVWGCERDGWPRHWRQDLAVLLEGLTWLHAGTSEGSGPPNFGTHTALLTHTADLRGSVQDDCADDCPGRGGPVHHHYLINVGRGFSGCLERFAVADDEFGVRRYEFPVGNKRSPGRTLWRTGKSGRLASVFLPAKLGRPAACEQLTAAQHRLLQALIRETTRKKRGRRTGSSEPEVIGNAVPDATGRASITCPMLAPGVDYVTFGGNKKRRGLGYRLTTPGGWLCKAGRSPSDLAVFLDDLAVLANRFDLLVAGLLPASNTWFRLEQLAAMASSSRRGLLDRVHLRVYTSADYVDRFSRFFGWSELPAPDVSPTQISALELAGTLASRGISRRALADGIGLDGSLLSKMLAGKRRCAPEVIRAAQEWLSRQPERPSAAADPLPRAVSEPPGSTLERVLDYHRRGWSIVPILPGAKRPLVRWKPYQDRTATPEELRGWFGQWPSAGPAVVLGPVSDLFVIDVDGREAHEALLQRLGSEPRAPKVLSGSREPFRYHLFFRCPPTETKAKQTPWHPHLEFRGRGGIVVLPPAIHKSGNPYAWLEGQSLEDVPLPVLPEPIVQALQPPRRRPSARPVPPMCFAPAISASPSTQAFLTGACADGPGWNSRLFAAAADLAGRQVPMDQAEPLLLAGAAPWTEAEAEAARRTIQSAYSQPREPGRY